MCGTGTNVDVLQFWRVEIVGALYGPWNTLSSGFWIVRVNGLPGTQGTDGGLLEYLSMGLPGRNLAVPRGPGTSEVPVSNMQASASEAPPDRKPP